MESVLRLLEYLAVRAALASLQAMSLAASRAAARALARAAFLLDARHRRRTIDHLRMAYGPALDDGRRRALALRVFDEMGRHAAEFAHLNRRDAAALQVEGSEILTRARAEGRGVVVASAHLGSFSLMARLARALRTPTAVVVKRQKNPRLLAWLRSSMGRLGVELIVKPEAKEAVPRALARGRVVVLFADQHPVGGGIPARFFGRPVQAAAGPAVYAARAGCPLLVATLVSRPDGTHLVRLEGPLPAEKTLAETSQRWLDALEARIREHPHQWMWMHRRWRDAEDSRPGAPGRPRP